MNLKKIIKDAQKAFGDESLMILGEKPRGYSNVLPTGIPSLDLALGIGGLPRGRIVEIYGEESCGKTTLSTKFIAQSQKLFPDLENAVIDAEHAFDADWAKRLGVNIEKLVFFQPNCGEEALQMVEHLIKTNQFSVILIDSVAALTPRAELEGEMGDAHMGIQARMMGQAMRKLTAIVSKSNTMLVFTNQTRASMNPYQSPNNPGGKALKFFASVRIHSYKKIEEDDKIGNDIIGNTFHLKIVKNKLAPPLKICTVKLNFEKGFNFALNVKDVLIEKGVIEKKKNSFFMNGKKVATGKKALQEFLVNYDQAKLEKIYNKVASIQPEVVKQKPKKSDEEE